MTEETGMPMMVLASNGMKHFSAHATYELSLMSGTLLHAGMYCLCMQQCIVQQGACQGNALPNTVSMAYQHAKQVLQSRTVYLQCTMLALHGSPALQTC